MPDIYIPSRGGWVPFLRNLSHNRGSCRPTYQLPGWVQLQVFLIVLLASDNNVVPVLVIISITVYFPFFLPHSLVLKIWLTLRYSKLVLGCHIECTSLKYSHFRVFSIIGHALVLVTSTRGQDQGHSIDFRHLSVYSIDVTPIWLICIGIGGHIGRQLIVLLVLIVCRLVWLQDGLLKLGVHVENLQVPAWLELNVININLIDRVTST